MISLHERMLPNWRGSNPQPPDCQSVALPIEPPRWAILQSPSSIVLCMGREGCNLENSLNQTGKQLMKLITKTCQFEYTENFTPKRWNFWDKNSDSFPISAQIIDCGYSLEPPWWDCSNEYPQSMFLSRNKKNNVYPCKPQFYYIKVGFKGSTLYRHIFMMC